MSSSTPVLPCRRPELVIRALAERGRYVVKNPRSGGYFQFGEEEQFLLMQLDGTQAADAACAAFAQRFGEPLTGEELQEFVDMANARDLLQQPNDTGERSGRAGGLEAETAPSPVSDPGAAPYGLKILHWRKSLVDPDRLFTWLAPRLWFFWTPWFFAFSSACIVAASLVLWANRHELSGSLLSALRWETAVWAWLAIFVVTMLHECAHGLTCKRYGGEVHEIGFLLLFFMPCFYCNVSDAWLFPEKSKRQWVTLAGGYFELFLWALSVFVWRVTTPGSLINYVAFVVLAACGVQTLFNLNPLLKLDGYYLLSDWAEVPNLQARSGNYLKSQIRRFLWGAARPDSEPRAGVLLLYGLASLLYSLIFLGIALVAFGHFLGSRWGLAGLAAVGLLTFVSLRGLLHGFTAGEVSNMFFFRRKRLVLWLLGVGGAVAALFLVRIEDRASGSCRLRPVSRAELRAPVAGFLKDVLCDEGDRVSPGQLLARLDVSDLESRLAQKQAEVGEVEAKLHLLQIGSRPEEISEQRQRVSRAQTWRDLAQSDLGRAREALQEDLVRLDKQILASKAEHDVAKSAHDRAKTLAARKAIADADVQEAAGKLLVSEARLSEAEAAKRAYQAKGSLEYEAELARREKEFADAQASLRLLEAGARPEEIQAQQAQLARMKEEVRHLQAQGDKRAVTAPAAGLVTTPRLREKVGQYLREGELICVVEEPDVLEAEVSLSEQDTTRVQVGQEVRLKARANPFETYTSRVDRIAPAAGKGEVQSSVTVYCRLESAPDDLRPEMTGYARIYTGRRPVALILLDRALRYVRTEFWW